MSTELTKDEIDQLIFEKDFAQDLESVEEVYSKIDAHYLLLITYLIIKLRDGTINQTKLMNESDALLADLEEDITTSTYTSIERTVINSMAGGFYSIVIRMGDKDLNKVIDNGKIGKSPYEEVLFEMAVAKAGGKLTADTAKEVIARSGIHSPQALRIFNDTYLDLLMATNNTSNQIKRIIREVSSEVLQLQGLLAKNNKELSKLLIERLSEESIFKRLTEEGLLGIIDAGGKRWQLDTYSKMVVNTKITDAHLQATKQVGQEIGVDLAIISYNASTVDECLSWEGVVVSVNGLTPGYPSLDAAIATNEVFHPNCRHHISLVNSFSDLTDEQQRVHLIRVERVKNPELRPYMRKSDHYH